MTNIPICKSWDSFHETNRKTRFLDRIPRVMVDGVEELRVEQAVHWIIRRLGQLSMEGFVEAAASLGYDLTTSHMDAVTAQPMWEETNINSRSQRTIMRYLRGYFGKKCSIPTVKMEEWNANIGNYDVVTPITNYTEVDGEPINFWNRRLLSSINFSISQRLFSDEKLDRNDKRLDLGTVDVVLGGDHGQEKFRMLMKIICRDSKLNVIGSWVMKVAHIDCKKDTYDILKTTIVPYLNEDVKELMKKENRLIIYKYTGIDDNDRGDSGDDGDGDQNQFMYTAQIGDLSIGNVDGGTGIGMNCFRCPLTGDERTNFQSIGEAKIRFFMTGDLAYYYVCVGKVNMSGKWCHWCDLGMKQRETDGHEKGND